ncbi:hypothetical protein PsorP6_002661 [Peronosclerospora sorghi]|uniref:Uncharacterized protein n=1 Tax=Peronosclerospora sorghi TaxID=230839 RepID=A0ACC0WU49_9STRA|nr:hypothetical protein PsorP6_002661 [Peronosclerospora sorghi]
MTGTPSLERTATTLASAKKRKRNNVRTNLVCLENMSPIDNTLKKNAKSISKVYDKEEQPENSCEKSRTRIQDLRLMQIQIDREQRAEDCLRKEEERRLERERWESDREKRREEQRQAQMQQMQLVMELLGSKLNKKIHIIDVKFAVSETNLYGWSGKPVTYLTRTYAWSGKHVKYLADVRSSDTVIVESMDIVESTSTIRDYTVNVVRAVENIFDTSHTPFWGLSN